MLTWLGCWWAQPASWPAWLTGLQNNQPDWPPPGQPLLQHCITYHSKKLAAASSSKIAPAAQYTTYIIYYIDQLHTYILYIGFSACLHELDSRPIFFFVLGKLYYWAAPMTAVLYVSESVWVCLYYYPTLCCCVSSADGCWEQNFREESSGGCKKRRLRHLDRRAVAASSRLTSILLSASVAVMVVRWW